MKVFKPFCAMFAGLAVAGGVFACDDGSGGSGGSGGSTSSSTSSTSTGSTSSSSSTGGGACSASNLCTGQGEYCLLPNDCSPTAMGTCQNFIQCDGPPTGPACGCDGVVTEAEYGDCTLHTASKAVAPASLCQMGTFACGPSTMCKKNAEVCVHTTGGAQGNETFACEGLATLTNTCTNGIPSCACLQAGQMCSADADHQETIQILAP